MANGRSTNHETTILCAAAVLLTLTSCYVGPAYPPRRTVIVPYGARPFYHNGVNYYNHQGVWYHPYGTGHVIGPRPF